MVDSSNFPSEYYVVDVGMHDGTDSIYYAKRGFKVISFEANPNLANDAKTRFSELGLNIDIRNFAISDAVGSVKFYVNRSRPQWSSLNSKLGSRAGGSVEIDVATCNLAEQLGALGDKVHMVKIDIEGYDFVAVRQIADLEHKPAYISVENGGVRFINLLSEMGYRKFKFANQKFNSLQRIPAKSKHGHFFDVAFFPHSSGLFGEDLPGRWLSIDEAVKVGNALENVRDFAPDNLFAESIGWFDMHAAL